MLKNGKAIFLQEKNTVTNICPVLELVAPLAFILYELQGIIGL